MLTFKFVCLVILFFILQISDLSDAKVSTKTKFLRFESEPESVYTKLKTKVHLKCLAKPKNSRIHWLINKEPVRIDQDAIFTTPDSLIIQLPERIDQNVGMYKFDELIKSEIQCRAEYKNQVLLSQPAKIIVAFLDDFPYSEDEIKIDVKEQQIAVIPCKPPNSPPRVVTYFVFKNKMIESNSAKYYLMPSGDLQIFNVSMEDSGQYQCIAYNPLLDERKNSTNLVTLHVERQFSSDASLEYDQSVTEKLDFLTNPKQKYSVIRGTESQIFECVASSILPVNVSWYRQDRKPLPKNRFKIVGGNLMLNQIQTTDQGFYYCEATNGHKTITAISELEVKQAPNIKTELESKRVQIGEQVEFDCSVNGHPMPLIEWYLNGVKLTNLNSAQFDAQLVMTREDTSKLILKKATDKHNGIVQCFASNDVSTVHSVAKLEVISAIDNASPITNEYSASSSSNKPNKPRNKSNKNRNKIPDMVAPSKPKIIRLSSDSVIVHWQKSRISREPITFFKIQYKDLELFNSTTDWVTVEEDISPYINSFAISSLQSDRFYKFRIIASFKNQDFKDGKVSDRFFLAKNPTSPRPVSIPDIRQSKSDSSNSIEIFWDCKFRSDEQVEGFIIHYRLTQSAETYKKITIDNNSTRKHLITHLMASKQYDIKIQSFNSAGVSDFSKIQTTSTQANLVEDSVDDSDDPYIDEQTDNDQNPLFNQDTKVIDPPKESSKEPSNSLENVNKTISNLPTSESPPLEDSKVSEVPDNSIELTNENNKTATENEQDNLKATVDPLSTQSPLFYAIVTIIVLINIIIFVYCYTIVKRWINAKKSKKQKGDDKFDLDDENFILKPEEDSFNRSFTKMNVFNEPLYSTNGVLSTNPHLTRKAIKNYNHNYATIGFTNKDRSVFSNKNAVYDSSLMNVRVNKFFDDSITNSLMAINKAGCSNQITKRDLPNHRISTTISHHNLTRPTNAGNHTMHFANTMHHQQSNLHNKNLLLPELSETTMKGNTSTLGRHRPTTRNFEDLYGTTGTVVHFATINRSNSVARLNGTLERKRKSSRNDLFSVLNIKEENELSPTQIVDLQSSPNFRTVRYVNNSTALNGGLNNMNHNGMMNSTMNMSNGMHVSMSNGINTIQLNCNTMHGAMNGVLNNNSGLNDSCSNAVMNNAGLNNLTNLTNLNNLNTNNTSLNSSNPSPSVINNSLNNYESTLPRTAYLTQQANLTQQPLHHQQQQQQQQQQQLTNNNRTVGMMQSSC